MYFQGNVSGSSLVEISNSVLAGQIRRLKNSRRGYVSPITTKQNEIERLLLDDENAEVVKERMEMLEELWIKFTKAHEEYHATLMQCSSTDSEDLDESDKNFKREERVVQCFNEKVRRGSFLLDLDDSVGAFHL